MKISFRKIVKSPALILILTLLSAANFTVKAQQNVSGEITGSIFDYQDAIILGNEVTIENQNFRKSVMTDADDGTYTLKVPAGIYTVTTKQGIWYSVKRAAFLVKANETTFINLNPTIRILSIALDITPEGKPVEYNRESKYEEFLPFSDSPFNIVIEYREKKFDRTAIIYRRAKLTYNNLTVYADALRFDKTKLLVEAEGNVTIDENGRRQKKQNATLQIAKVETVK